MNPTDYNPKFDRNSKGKFNIDNNFMSIKAGSEGAIIEDEVNEQQWIQIEQLAQTNRSLMNSGFLLDSLQISSDAETDFNKNGCFYIKNISGISKLLLNINNYLPVNMNGYIFRLAGQSNVSPDNNSNVNNNILIDIPDYAPNTGATKDSILILEAYIKEIGYGDEINYLGGLDNQNNKTIFEEDSRLSLPTTHRTQLVWQFRIIPNLTTLTENSIYPFNNTSLNKYKLSSNTVFNDEYFNRDKTLYISTNDNTTGSINGEFYAIPILHFIQNKGVSTIKYSQINNFNPTAEIVVKPDTSNGITIGGDTSNPIKINTDDSGNVIIVDNNGVYKTLKVGELDIVDSNNKIVKLKNNSTGLVIQNPDNSTVNINDLKTKSDTNSTNISNLTTKVTNNTNDINTINNDIDNINNNVTNITNNVTNITNTSKLYTTTNSGNVYSVSVPNVSTLTDGFELCLKINADSTGNISVKVNSLSPVNVMDYYGGNVTDVKTNVIIDLRYNITTGNFILLGKGGEMGSLDKQKLVDITNETVSNNDTIKTTIVNTVNTNLKKNLLTNSTWNTINDNINANDILNDRIIQLSDLDPYYETIQGTSWSKTVEGNITNIKVNTLTDLSVIVSDDLNNLYKFDTNGNQLWKTNVGYIVKFIRCDNNNNIYITGMDNNNNYGAFKYNLSGIKTFTYDNFTDKKPIYVDYDSYHNQVFILYPYSNVYPGGSASNQKWITYDLSNNIIQNVFLTTTTTTVYNIKPFTGRILSSGELICTSGSLTTNAIMKFNTSGQLTNSHEWTSDHSGVFNVMNNGHIILITYSLTDSTVDTGITTISILDSNFNLLQTPFNVSNDLFRVNDDENACFINDTNYICNNDSSTYLSMINYDINTNTPYIYKTLSSGSFDYDNKYLYYSKNGTNILSKINFDKDIIQSETINKSDASGYAYKIDDIPVCDSENNIYIISGFIGNHYDSTPPNRIFKYDNNLNKITEFDITTSLATKHLGFFIINDYIYLLYKGIVQNIFLQKIDLQGNLIFEKQLNSGGDATTDSIYKLYNAYFDKYTNTIICCYDGYTNFLITDLNGNLIKKISLNTIGGPVPYNNILINTDKNNNIYISRQSYSDNNGYYQTIEKYDKNFNFILYYCNYSTVSATRINYPIIINNNLDDNNIYLYNSDNNGLSIYNQNGTYINKNINSNITQIINNGIVNNNKIYVYSIIKIEKTDYSKQSFNCISVLSVDNVDEPIYIITPQISIDYTPLFTFDSNNNIIYCINNTIYKIPAIENTNAYQIFKGYKLKSI